MTRTTYQTLYHKIRQAYGLELLDAVMGNQSRLEGVGGYGCHRGLELCKQFKTCSETQELVKKESKVKFSENLVDESTSSFFKKSMEIFLG